MGEDHVMSPVPTDESNAQDLNAGENKEEEGIMSQREENARFILRRDVRYCCSFPTYLFSARLRFGYTFFLLAAMVFVFMIAFVFEIFFSVLLPSSREAEGWGLRAAFMLPFAPIILIFGAAVLDEVFDLFFDAVSPGLLLNFRLRLVAVIHTIRHFRDPCEIDVDQSTYVCVEVITPFLMELIPFIGFLWTGLATRHIMLAVGAYFQMAMLYGCFIVLAWAICELLTHYKYEFRATSDWIKERNARPVSHAAWKLSAGFESGLLFPWWQLWPKQWFTSIKAAEERKDALARNDWEAATTSWWCCYRYARMYRRKVPYVFRVIADIVLFILVAFLIVMKVLDFSVGWMMLCVIMFLMAMKLQEKFPKVLGITFMATQAFFTIFAAMLFLFAASGVSPSSGYHGLPPSPEDAGIVLNASSGVCDHTYGVCSRAWNGMDVVDLGIMSTIAYASSTDNYIELMHQAFDNTAMANWTLRYRSPQEDPISFTEVYFPATNFSVIGVRGTSTAVEAYYDINEFGAISIFQFVDKFLPILSVIPETTMQQIIKSIALSSISGPPVYEKVLNYAEELASKQNVVVTGHSLGGAIANIVAGRVRIPSVSFSPPGLRYESLKIELDLSALRRHVTAIVPDFDVFPKVDVQVGSVQYIDCTASVPGCHSIDNTLCTLLDVCGNARKRGIKNYCETTSNEVAKLK